MRFKGIKTIKKRIVKDLNWFEDNANRLWGEHMLRNNIKRGFCQACHKKKGIAHHPDYSKPLQIIWLCRKCHSKVHLGKLNVNSYPRTGVRTLKVGVINE